MTTYHSPANGDLFAPTALCGADANDEPDGVLRMHASDMEATCARCRQIRLEGVR